MEYLRKIAIIALVICLCGFRGVSGSNANSALTGSQFQIPSFTATNAAAGDANLLTDSTHDFLLPGNASVLGIGATTNKFTLGERDPNGDVGIGVPTFRSSTANLPTALDVIPNGSATDGGYGKAWSDICNSDITNAGGSPNTTCLHLGARASGEVDIGENRYGTGSIGPVVIVGGGGNGSGATQLASFGTAGFGFIGAMAFQTIYSAAGTAVPTASASTHYRVCVSDSTACTSGTTYTSGGSTACELWSNGTNWLESGSGC